MELENDPTLKVSTVVARKEAHKRTKYYRAFTGAQVKKALVVMRAGKRHTISVLLLRANQYNFEHIASSSHNNDKIITITS